MESSTPDSAIACLAAPAANLVCRPRTFQPSASRPALEASQFLTSAEILVGNLLASKMVVKPTPDFPSLRPDQTSSTLCPIGFTEPTPVTTTRLRMKPPLIQGSFKVSRVIILRLPTSFPWSSVGTQGL